MKLHILIFIIANMPRISVGVRIRPDTNPTDRKLDGLNIDSTLIELSVSGTQHSFTFDNIFPDTSRQEDIFKSAATNIIDGVLEGYNGCLFAYGQTGAG